MTELNGNDDCRYGVSLPTDSQYSAKIEAGDLMLYGSNCLVLFYGAAGGYSYTRIGKLASMDGLVKAVGNSAATVTFEKAASRRSPPSRRNPSPLRRRDAGARLRHTPSGVSPSASQPQRLGTGLQGTDKRKANNENRRVQN